jgi:hypothetical protein
MHMNVFTVIAGGDVGWRDGLELRVLVSSLEVAVLRYDEKRSLGYGWLWMGLYIESVCEPQSKESSLSNRAPSR